jgi:serine protease
MQTIRQFLLAAAALAAAGVLVTGQAQTSREAGPPARVLVHEVGPGAIDNGLDGGDIPEVRRQGTPRRQRLADSALPYQRGKVIVKFRDTGVSGTRSETTRAGAMRTAGGRNLTRPSHADFDVMEIDREADPEAVAALLSAQPDVEYAQAAYRVHAYQATFLPNDPLYPQQWNFQIIGMEHAWAINQGASPAVIVAVLDTGVAYRNAAFTFTATAWEEGGQRYPALGPIAVPFAAAPELGGADRFVAPRDFIYDDTSPVDTDGHGTHVAGTIGQLTNNAVGVAGMAFNVRIMPVKCISGEWDDIFDSPFVGTDDVVARAIRYAADNGAKVLNLSIGRTGGAPATAIGEAMRYAVSRGAFLAVAAGNDYEDGNPVERLAEQAGPIAGAIVVAAVGVDRNRAYYSGVHPYVEIAAPGGNARLPNGGILQQTYDPAFADTFLRPPAQYVAPRFDVFAYRRFQGTSMSTAHVSGLAALLISQGITNPAAIEAAMKQFAQVRGPAGRTDEYGHGLIDPRATLRGLGILR